MAVGVGRTVAAEGITKPAPARAAALASAAARRLRRREIVLIRHTVHLAGANHDVRR
jgi:hypothetical protein